MLALERRRRPLRNCMRSLTSQHGNIPGNQAILRTLPVVVSLDVEFHDRTNRKLGILVEGLGTCQQGVPVYEKVTSKSVRIDETPCALERSNISPQPVANPVTRSQQCSRRYLFGNCSTAIIQGNVKLDDLARAKDRLSISTCLRARLKKKVIPMNEEITIKGCSVKESPTLSKTPHITPMPLAQNIIRLSPQDWLHSHRHGFAVFISLHVELYALILVERVCLEFWHYAV
mmetsp:Transcript_71301/g.167029  ORF Transcript_71301/g.167029 Transcript_71301/m.167029 type:complete len:231 (+) Transcript_71301:342-1034(+)